MTTATETKKQNPIVRFLTMNTSREVGGRDLPLWRQILLQLLTLAIVLEVMFPIMYIITLSFSSKTERPSTLQLIPQEISTIAYQQVLDRPTANPVSFAELLKNSFLLSFGVGLVALLVAVTAAYAFSRFKFKMRQVLMVLIFIPLLMPAVGLSTPLYLLMNSIRVTDCGSGVTAIAPFITCAQGAAGKLIFNLRDSLLGVGIAMISGALPFAVWNLKGYLDTIPKELEEAALIDGCTPIGAFFRVILPLVRPGLATQVVFTGMSAWNEYFMSSILIRSENLETLPLGLVNFTGRYSTNFPQLFAALAIATLPVIILYIMGQKQFISGMTAGAVKG